MVTATICSLIVSILAVVQMTMTRAALSVYQDAALARRQAAAMELEAKVSVVRAGLVELNHWRKVNGLDPIEMANEWEVSMDP